MGDFTQMRTCPDCKNAPVASGRAYCTPCGTKRTKLWRDRNIDRRRAGDREYSRKKKLEVFARYGGACACCGEATIEFLTIDHKLNNGNAERRAYKSQTWKIAIKRGFPNDYQILCYNCNNAKANHGICPHESKPSAKKSTKLKGALNTHS